MVTHQDKRILLRQQLSAVLTEFLFMVFPYTVMQLPRCSQHGLVMQVQISDRVQAHHSSPPYTALRMLSFSLIVQSENQTHNPLALMNSDHQGAVSASLMRVIM
jgi:hypothetical protein